MTQIVHYPLTLRVPKKKEFRTPFPVRSPLQTAEVIKDLLHGKIICDVGCSRGDMVLQFAKYAKFAFGINNDEHESEIARKRGAAVIVDDAMTMEVPYADYYFFYWGPGDATPFLEKMYESHPHPFTILASGHEDQKFLKEYAERWNASKIITFRYREKETCDLGLGPRRGHWRLVVLEKE
jgi:hypothetical protein